MAIFYTPRGYRERFLSPQFTRMRQRYKGPKDSYRVNLLHSQMRYMFTKLYEQIETVRTNFKRNADTFDLGETPAGVTHGTTSGDAVALDVPGIDEMARDLEALKYRIESLERS